MKLTDTKIKYLKSKHKLYRENDGNGLYIEVTPSETKLWRLRYQYNGKQSMLSLGKYPEISLKKARYRRDEAREQLANGIDPSLAKKQQKAVKTELSENTFEVVAREWHGKQKKKWSTGQAQKTLAWLETNISLGLVSV
ncbi:MAG: Arm DNA-binding domain-containing protein [Methylococcales bacterium]